MHAKKKEEKEKRKEKEEEKLGKWRLGKFPFLRALSELVAQKNSGGGGGLAAWMSYFLLQLGLDPVVFQVFHWRVDSSITDC